MTSDNPAPRRSTRLLVLGVFVAVLAGVAGAVLKPDPMVVSPGNLAISAKSGATPVDLGELQRSLLDRLVADAAVSDPSGLPALTSYTALFARHPDANRWILERLFEPDASPALRTAFAQRLPRGRAQHDAAADRLLGPLLTHDIPAVRRAALDVLRSRNRLQFTSSPECACGFGVHPRDPVAGDPMTVVAFGASKETLLAWTPRPTDDGTGLLLDLRRDPTGEPVLAQRLDPAPTVRVVGHAPPSVEVLVTVRESR